ncbi:hypothetical protein C8R41DRAFT_307501 [Lentinula lateritia]|uniref:Uncharacterized protein n=1 Tax=Lentinula lateritia TaxID=40482 RepID=A0ABQ8VKK2_9AGAR|nr:hypothetical protein C8R41DRAFT_307501 [Lentinula lateritia]
MAINLQVMLFEDLSCESQTREKSQTNMILESYVHLVPPTIERMRGRKKDDQLCDDAPGHSICILFKRSYRKRWMTPRNAHIKGAQPIISLDNFLFFLNADGSDALRMSFSCCDRYMSFVCLLVHCTHCTMGYISK